MPELLVTMIKSARLFVVSLVMQIIRSDGGGLESVDLNFVLKGRFLLKNIYSQWSIDYV